MSVENEIPQKFLGSYRSSPYWDQLHNYLDGMKKYAFPEIKYVGTRRIPNLEFTRYRKIYTWKEPESKLLQDHIALQKMLDSGHLTELLEEYYFDTATSEETKKNYRKSDSSFSPAKATSNFKVWNSVGEKLPQNIHLILGVILKDRPHCFVPERFIDSKYPENSETPFEYKNRIDRYYQTVSKELFYKYVLEASLRLDELCTDIGNKSNFVCYITQNAEGKKARRKYKIFLWKTLATILRFRFKKHKITFDWQVVKWIMDHHPRAVRYTTKTYSKLQSYYPNPKPEEITVLDVTPGSKTCGYFSRCDDQIIRSFPEYKTWLYQNFKFEELGSASLNLYSGNLDLEPEQLIITYKELKLLLDSVENKIRQVNDPRLLNTFLADKPDYLRFRRPYKDLINLAESIGTDCISELKLCIPQDTYKRPLKERESNKEDYSQEIAKEKAALLAGALDKPVVYNTDLLFKNVDDVVTHMGRNYRIDTKLLKDFLEQEEFKDFRAEFFSRNQPAGDQLSKISLIKEDYDMHYGAKA